MERFFIKNFKITFSDGINDPIFDTFAFMNQIEEIATKIKNRLKRPLPGTSAHLKMATKFRLNELKSGYDVSKAKKSGVLISLYPNNGSLFFLLIERQKDRGIHSGQISFPGGAMEKSDKDYFETAIREANEEVGLKKEDINIIGSLTELYIPPSNFLVFPVVGYLNSKPIPVPDPNEVAGIIEADLTKLLNSVNVKWKKIEVRGHKIKAPYFDINGYTVWGATAMILNELIEIIKSS